MEVKIETLSPTKVVYVRHVGPYAECKKAWDTLLEWAQPKNIFTEHTKFLGICHDDPEQVSPDNIRYDAAVTIQEEVPTEGKVQLTSIPGGEYATLLHKGPYESLGTSWNAIFKEWLPQSGRESRCGEDAVCFEHYLNDPTTTEPSELLTRIHIPLK